MENIYQFVVLGGLGFFMLIILLTLIYFFIEEKYSYRERTARFDQVGFDKDGCLLFYYKGAYSGDPRQHVKVCKIMQL